MTTMTGTPSVPSAEKPVPDLWDPISEYEGGIEPLLTPEVIEDQQKVISKPGPVVNKRKCEGLMLCNVFKPEKPPKWDSVIFEQKFDGYRCIAIIRDGVASLLTSTGIPHWNTRFIKNQLEAAAVMDSRCNNVVLDGEIVHDTLDFDTAGGILRKHEDDSRADGFVLHAWDWIPLEHWDLRTAPYLLSARKACLDEAVNLFKVFGSHVVAVKYYLQDLSTVEDYAREFVIEDGMEGIIIKKADAPYSWAGKAGTTWLKWKPKFEVDCTKEMKEGDFRITGIKHGRGKHQGRVGSIHIRGYLQEDGNISPDPEPGGLNKEMNGKAGTGPSDAERIEFMTWFNEGTLVGRCVECHYQELSSKGKVRFPVYYRLRPDKDE